MLDSKYHIVTPAPKPKVKVALYAYKTQGGFWHTGGFFYADDSDFIENNKTRSNFKRLDWSEMEVDE